MDFKARQIKFKVYDRKTDTCHIVGQYNYDDMWCRDNEVFYHDVYTGSESVTSNKKLPEERSGYILMQYTGFNIDDTELYEYDIIQCNYAFGVIIFKNGMWYVVWEKGYEERSNDLYSCLSSEQFILVGNYFEESHNFSKRFVL